MIDVTAPSADAVKRLARELGFDTVGIISMQNLPQRNIDALQSFVSDNWHGEMHWMQKNIDTRCRPQEMMPKAQSIVMVGMNYAPAHDPLAWLEQKSQGAIACYALGRDYHDVLKKNLRRLTRRLGEDYGAESRMFVDTAPVAEKPLAALAGLGWQGKHSNLVSRERGSWLFLGGVMTSLSFADDDSPAEDCCGNCQACIDICPTAAIVAPYRLDARKCIAYLTIEHPGSIDVKYRKSIGNRIFGCDDCLAVCPWNKFAKDSRHIEFATRDSLRDRSLAEFLSWDEAAFRKNFSKSPIKRLGFRRFIRNLLIAAGNSQDRRLLGAIAQWRACDDDMLRETARWAYESLTADSKDKTAVPY